MRIRSSFEDVSSSTTRGYNSPRRAAAAAETRENVISAAAETFSTRGWASTSMRSIAAEAGVSVETIYSSVGGKLDLLEIAIGRGVVGDDEAVGLADRPEFRALSTGPLSQRFAAVARLIRGINERIGGPAAALAEASRSDERAAQLRDRLEDARRTDVERGLRAVLERPPMKSEVDECWLLTSIETYDQLVRGAGWSPDEFEAWLARILELCFTPGGNQ